MALERGGKNGLESVGDDIVIRYDMDNDKFVRCVPDDGWVVEYPQDSGDNEITRSLQCVAQVFYRVNTEWLARTTYVPFSRLNIAKAAMGVVHPNEGLARAALLVKRLEGKSLLAAVTGDNGNLQPVDFARSLVHLLKFLEKTQKYGSLLVVNPQPEDVVVQKDDRWGDVALGFNDLWVFQAAGVKEREQLASDNPWAYQVNRGVDNVLDCLRTGAKLDAIHWLSYPSAAKAMEEVIRRVGREKLYPPLPKHILNARPFRPEASSYSYRELLPQMGMVAAAA